jgi:hypothetical protein
VAAEPAVFHAFAGRTRDRVLGTRWQSGTRRGRSCFSAWRWRWRPLAAGSPSADAPAGAVAAALAIGTWVGGFDALARQDLEFDRAHGLRSIPVRFGVPGSLAISRLMHVVAIRVPRRAGVRGPARPPVSRGRRHRRRAPRIRAVARARRRSVTGEARSMERACRHSLPMVLVASLYGPWDF